MTAINNALAAYPVTNVTTTITAGVNTNGTTNITISIQVPDGNIDAIHAAVLAAVNSATKGTGAQFIAVVKAP